MKNSLEEFKCDANEAIMFKLGKFLKPNKKIPVFRVTRPYLNLRPGRAAQSVTCLATDACLTVDPGVASSVPYFRRD